MGACCSHLADEPMATLKNKSDLAEFPDGGRATLVRRYSPTLTRRELAILIACPYEAPGLLQRPDGEYRTGCVLVRRGLLERDPSSASANGGVFRVTEAGAEVVARWKSAGLLP
jgi:hypothetical protein